REQDKEVAYSEAVFLIFRLRGSATRFGSSTRLGRTSRGRGAHRPAFPSPRHLRRAWTPPTAPAARTPRRACATIAMRRRRSPSRLRAQRGTATATQDG